MLMNKKRGLPAVAPDHSITALLRQGFGGPPAFAPSTGYTDEAKAGGWGGI